MLHDSWFLRSPRGFLTENCTALFFFAYLLLASPMREWSCNINIACMFILLRIMGGFLTFGCCSSRDTLSYFRAHFSNAILRHARSVWLGTCPKCASRGEDCLQGVHLTLHEVCVRLCRFLCFFPFCLTSEFAILAVNYFVVFPLLRFNLPAYEMLSFPDFDCVSFPDLHLVFFLP